MEVGEENLHVDASSHLLEVSVTVNVFSLMGILQIVTLKLKR